MLNKKPRTATVAVINEYKQLLILRRGKTAPWMPGRYCLPGGHVEINENLQYGAARELSEEAGISYPVDELKGFIIRYDSGYHKTVWIARVIQPRILLNYEHDHYSWVNYSNFDSYPLVPRLKTTILSLYKNGYIV